MIRNERGSSLVMVLLVSLVFVTIGLTILSVSINGTKRTEIRRLDALAMQDSVGEMNRIIADFQSQIIKLTEKKNLTQLLKNTSSPQGYDGILNTIQQELQKKYTNADGDLKKTVLIEDRTNLLSDKVKAGASTKVMNLNDFKQRFFTRYYTISLIYTDYTNKDKPEIKKTITRNITISPTPSFLQYAVGSEENLVLNGASHIVGNAYGKVVTINNLAELMYTLPQTLNNVVNGTVEAPYPLVEGDLIISDRLNLVNKGILKESIDKDKLASAQKGMLSNFFFKNRDNDENVPNIKKATKEFVSIDFPKTVTDKLNKLEIVPNKTNTLEITKEKLKETNIAKEILTKTGWASYQNNISSYNNSTAHSVYLLSYSDQINGDFSASSKKVLLATNLENSVSALEGILNPVVNGNSKFIINSNLSLNEDQWLIVNGDLEIYSTSPTPVSIQGNIIVLGDVTIHGNEFDFNHEENEIQFDSTMYVMGKTNIFSVNITRLKTSQLVLLSQGNLVITRINEFKELNSGTNDVKPLQAYFYTDSAADLYGVGSYMSIQGGLFAKGTLTINAIRQNSILTSTTGATNIFDIFTQGKLNFKSAELQKDELSRFSVVYDKSIVLNQLDALPSVDSLQVLIDDYKLEK